MADERKRPACTECKEKKLRCVYSQPEDETCNRCERLGKQCQIPEVKQRKRKARLRGRVEQLESSYSEILSLLKHQHQRPRTSSSRTESLPPTPSVADTQQTPSTEFVSPAGAASNPADAHEGQEHIPLAECEGLVNDYRRMSQANFPYVIIPVTCSAAALIDQRPMLAQAVFIVTSWRKPARQSVLKASFLQELGHRYFVRSERSLDLLQALIVYFGWCQWYAMPVTSQAYRLGSLVATMAMELGINQRPMSVTQHDMIVSGNTGFAQTNEVTSSKFWSYETRRVFIGAYIISTFCLLLSRRPSILAYTQYLEDCAASLAADPQYPTDPSLIYIVRSHHIAEQVTSSFDEGSKEKVELSDEKLQLLVRTLARQVDDWRATLPSTLPDLGRLERNYLSVRAHVHEVGLYGLLQGQTASVTRVSIIYECFNSAMRLLSNILDLSLDEMADFTSIDLRSLNFAVMLSTKSSIILDSAYCSTEASQRAAWLDRCLDTLCLRTKELIRLSGASQSKDNYYRKLSADWTNVKAYHQSCIQRGLAHAASSSSSSTTAATATASASAATSMPAPSHQVVPFLDNPLDMDPFTEFFWTGVAESEVPLNPIFPI